MNKQNILNLIKNKNKIYSYIKKGYRYTHKIQDDHIAELFDNPERVACFEDAFDAFDRYPIAPSELFEIDDIDPFCYSCINCSLCIYAEGRPCDVSGSKNSIVVFDIQNSNKNNIDLYKTDVLQLFQNEVDPETFLNL